MDKSRGRTLPSLVFGLERLGLAALAFPRTVALVALVCAALAGIGVDKLKVVRSVVPAITHVDYSARVQTVDRARHARRAPARGD